MSEPGNGSERPNDEDVPGAVLVPGGTGTPICRI